MNKNFDGEIKRASWLVLGALALSGVATGLGCGGADGKPAVSPDNVDNVGDAGDVSAATSSSASGDPAPKWDSTASNQGTGSSGSTGSSTSTASGSDTSSAAAAALGPVPTSTPAAHRTDVYDKEETEIALKRAARQVKANCGSATGSDGKATGPWGSGTVQVTLGHNGHSKGVTVGPPFDGTPPGKCTIQAFSNLTFPPWGGQDTTVPWDIEIPQPTSAKK